MAVPRVLILRAPGANCDVETQHAFETAGAPAERVHINRLRERPDLLHRFQILANQLAHFLGEPLQRFRDSEKLILGICNGFQVLLKAGLIVPPDEDGPLVTLTNNSSGRYEDRWVHLRVTPGQCPFLAGYERLHVPVGHGEGRVVFREAWIGQGLEQSGQAVLHYVDAEGRPGPYPINPNGSEGDVAGLCDASGRVLGLMPHPDRHFLPTQHPHWTRRGLAEEGDGLKLFRNAVEFFKS